MESRFQRILLSRHLRRLLAPILCCIALAPAGVYAQEDDDELGQIITPDIERREIKEDMLDSEDFEIGAYFGLLNVEDFGSNNVTGVTLAYHVTEDFFLEAAYAQGRTEKTSYELLSGGVELLTDEERDLTYYNLSIGYNLFPGQVYVRNWAFNTRIYLIAGAGNTEFASKEYFTYNVGAGLRFYATDWISFDLSMRNHAFTHELFGESKSINNLEARFGMSLFF
jgi:outer membrane beta-barrel protein